MQYVAVLGYSEAFNKPLPSNSLDFLKDYPTEVVLLKLSKINAILFQENILTGIDIKIIREVIFYDVPGFNEKNEFGAFTPQSRWFSSASISMLITDCVKNFIAVDPNRSINTLEFARNLLRTILVYNQLYYSRFRERDMENLEAVFKLEVMQQGYLRNKGPLKIVTLMKFAFISKFLDVHEPLKEEAVFYCQKVGLGNPWLFGKFFLEVLTMAMTNANTGKHVLDVEGMPELLVREFSLDVKSLKTKEQLSLNMDVVPKPFYFLTAKQAIILDYSFFQYPIEQGFFYSFYQNGSSALSERFKDFPHFKSYIGLEFFERFLVEKYLKGIFFRREQRIVSTEKYQDFIVKSSASDIFIFEVKMVDVNVRTIEQMDYQKFKAHLDDNFLSEKGKFSKNKGVAQLVRQIYHLSESGSELKTVLGVKSSKQLNVYPIIICSDSNMNLAGVNNYLEFAFDEKIYEYRKYFQSIKPVMIVHIDFLVEYFGVLKKKPSLFAELINGYIKNKKNLEKRYKENGGIHNYYVSKRSFESYLNAKDFPDPMHATVNAMEETFDLEIVDFGKDQN